jgi:hypothetical protein
MSNIFNCCSKFKRWKTNMGERRERDKGTKGKGMGERIKG